MQIIMNLKHLKTQYIIKKSEIKKRLKEFENLKPEDYFYEVCFCVLTPQSNAYKCDECITILKEKDFLNKNIKIENYLKTKTRFHKNKSNYLLEIKNNYNKIKNNIKKTKPIKSREYLVSW